jgi:perosamine synthetase
VLAAGIQPGDEVLVPAFTWISTANAVELAGAKPIFCEIDSHTYNIDLNDARKRISLRTKAIIPVHLFGLPADMAAVKDLSNQTGLIVIEDAACALGTYFRQKHVGTFGKTGCFSFHPRKSITTGEGGMILTDDPDDFELFLKLRNIGSDRSGISPDFSVLGFNYRMTDIQAAIGLAQCMKFEKALQLRKSCARNYNTLIKNSSLANVLETPITPDGCVHSYQSYVCKILAEGDPDLLSTYRNQWIELLSKNGIETRPGTHAPCFLSYYRNKYGYEKKDYPNAYLADRLSIALPLYPGLTFGEQQTVIGEMTELWASIYHS